MKILGVSGSPRKDAATDQLVQAVLAGAEGCETEFVSLARKRIWPCIACLACADDNICEVKDDMTELRDKIVEADAYVIGGGKDVFVGNLLVCDNPEIFLELDDLRPGRARITANNPTYTDVTITVQPGPGFDLLGAFSKKVQVPASGLARIQL